MTPLIFFSLSVTVRVYPTISSRVLVNYALEVPLFVLFVVWEVRGGELVEGWLLAEDQWMLRTIFGSFLVVVYLRVISLASRGSCLYWVGHGSFVEVALDAGVAPVVVTWHIAIIDAVDQVCLGRM